MAEAIIFGAGKIARGFLGQLLFNAGVSTAFVDVSETLVQLMRERGRYTVNVLGAPEKNSVVSGYRVYCLSDAEGIAQEAREARVIFTAMGGKNLESAAPAVAKAARAAGRPINVITCENWKHPARILESAARRQIPDLQAGFAEAVVMRSAIEATPEQLAQDPLTVNVQNFWRLPLDGSALAAPLPNVPELEPLEHFQGFLERKFYTYNAANATVSYVGSLLGLTHISEAARDDRVSALLEKVYLETGAALSRKHGVSMEEQMAFAATSRAKLRDEVIVDTLERNARDPMRKLGPEDRLVGSANLCLREGVRPEALSTAIACALYYDSPSDPSAVELKRIREENGVGFVLENVCGMKKDGELYPMVIAQVEKIREKGWIR